MCEVDFLLPQFGDKSSCTNTVLAVTVWKREAVKKKEKLLKIWDRSDKVNPLENLAAAPYLFCQRETKNMIIN